MIRKVNSTTPSAPPSNWPVNILAAMMFLIPAVGVPNEYVLQDTLKSAIAAFGILLAALVFFWQQRERTAPLVWHPMLWLPLLLMAYALGSMMWSHAYLAGVEAIRWFLVSLLMWLLFNTVHAGNNSRLLWGLHWGAFVASVWVALQFWFDFKLFPQAAPPASTFVNRNFFAEYAVSVLPISVYLLLAQPYSRWVGWIALTVAFDLVAILMTGTRSALLALAVTTPLMVLATMRYRHVMACANWSRTQRAMIAAIALAAIAILGSIPSGNAEIGVGRTPLAQGNARSASMGAALHGKDYSFSTRLEMWKSTARMIMANPWSGVGAGAWEIHSPLYQRKDTSLEIDFYAHNDHLQLLSEYGAIVGGLTLAVLFAHALRSVASIVRRTPRPRYPLDALSGMAAISLLALLLVANAGFPLHLAAGCTLLALALANTAGRVGNATRGKLWHLSWSTTSRPAVLTVLVVLLGVTLVVTQRAMQGEYLLVRSINTYAEIVREAQRPGNDTNALHSAMVEDIQSGMALVPHYRKLLTESGDHLVSMGDWANVVPVWETVAQSRPNIPAVWTILAIAYARTQQHELASTALAQVQRLRPNDLRTTTLEIQLKKEAGDLVAAKELLQSFLSRGIFSYDMLQLAYVVGYQTQELSLAIQAMELRNAGWPGEAPDGHMRLGKLYADPRLNDDKKALAHFAQGLQSVPVNEQENYLAQIPEKYRSLRDDGSGKGRSYTLRASDDARRRGTSH